MVGCRHATTIASCQRTIRPPRAKSGRGAAGGFWQGTESPGYFLGGADRPTPARRCGRRHGAPCPTIGALCVGPAAMAICRSSCVGSRSPTRSAWYAARRAAGTGSLHLGRLNSFLIEEDDYLLRYVERIPFRGNDRTTGRRSEIQPPEPFRPSDGSCKAPRRSRVFVANLTRPHGHQSWEKTKNQGTLTPTRCCWPI
jgi:hypothetical protein